MRGPRTAAWLAGLGGLLAVVVVAAAAWGVRDVLSPAGADERRSRALLRTPAARVSPPAAVAAGADIASVRRLRAIAAGQLREADHELSACPSGARVSRSARDLAAWGDCARWHVGRLDISSRINARILYTAAQRLPPGRCQRTATGRANAMMLLAEAARELLSGAWDRSRQGRTVTMHRIAQLRTFVRDLSDHLRRSARWCTRITAAE